MNKKFQQNTCELDEAGLIDKNYRKKDKNPRRTNKIIALIISLFLLIIVFRMRSKDKLKLTTSQPVNKINDIEVENIDLSNFHSGDLIENLNHFTSKNSSILISKESNPVFSPLSLYISTASLAEASEGYKKDSLNSYLELDSLEDQSEKIKYLIHQIYSKTDQHNLVLSNSFWIKSPAFSQEKLVKKAFIHQMSNNYYSQIFTGDFGRDELREDMNIWLDFHLGESLNNFEINEFYDSLSLLSTINYKDGWKSSFNKEDNVWAPFKNGTKDVEYMIKEEISYTSQGEEFITASLATQHGDIHLIKAKPGYKIEELLREGELISKLQDADQNKEIVRYTIPKIDLFTYSNLLPRLEDDLSSILKDNIELPYIGDNIELSSLSQAIKLRLDEQGINSKQAKSQDKHWTDSNFTYLDFVLDEEFIFIINENTDFGQLPLFIGLINNIE